MLKKNVKRLKIKNSIFQKWQLCLKIQFNKCKNEKGNYKKKKIDCKISKNNILKID